MTDLTTLDPVAIRFEDGGETRAWWTDARIDMKDVPAGWRRYSVMGGKNDDAWEPCAIRSYCLVNHTADILTRDDLDTRIDKGDALIADWWFEDAADRPMPVEFRTDRREGRPEGDDRARLRAEVTGYITGYFQDAADGHNYYAAAHPGRTTRDMALDYMRERYHDYLAGIDQEQGAGTLAMLADQSPEPVHAADAIDAAMQAFDHMFEAIWPDPTPDAEERAAALQLTLNRYDEADDPDRWTIPAEPFDKLTQDLENTVREIHHNNQCLQ